MRLSTLVTVSGLLAAGARAWEHALPGSLQATFSQNEFVLVAFVAPSQPQSQSLEAEWLRVQNEGTDVPRLSVDCERHPQTCRQFGGVDVADPGAELPSIALFRNRRLLSRYLGARRSEAFLQFAWRARRSPTVTPVDGLRLERFRAIDDIVFVAFLEQADEASRKRWEDVAEEFRDEFTFGVVTDPEAAKSQGVTAPGVVCYKAAGGDTVTMSTPFSDDGALKEFIEQSSRLVITELTTLNHKRLLDRAWPMVYLFAATPDERMDLKKKLFKFARDQYETLTIVLVDPSQFPDLQAKLGLEPGVFPAGAVHQLSKDRIFPYPKGQPIDSASLQKWGLAVQQGRVRPWTPPGVTTSYDDLRPGKTATTKISMAGNWPGAAKIKVAGRDEL